MQAKDIMSVDVVTIKLDATIKDAVQLCINHKISGLVVVNDHDDAVAILSEKDLLVAFDFLGKTSSPIKEFVSQELVSVTENTSLEEVARILVQRNFKRVAVIKNKKAIGIVSRGDILHWISKIEN